MQDMNSKLLETFYDFEEGRYEQGLYKLKELEINATYDEKLVIIKGYIELGLLEDARKLANELDYNVNDIRLMRLNAEMSYMERDLDLSLELMHKVIDESGTMEDYTFIAQLYFDEGLPEVSLRYMNKAIDEYEPTGHLYYLRGLYAYELGNIEDAIDDFQSAIRMEEEALYYLALAHAFYSLGNFEDALDNTDQVLLLYPEQEEALYLKGNLLAQIGEINDGIEYIKRLVVKQPENPDVLLSLANLYEMNHDHLSALNILSSVLAIDEFNLSAIIHLAEIHLVHHDIEEAKKVIDIGLGIEPSNEQLLKLQNEFQSIE